MQRDRAFVVRRGLRDEVDDHPGLLARVGAHDPPDPLLVDAPRGGRGEVHHDRGARGVPALGEQHRVDQDGDLATLVGSEGLGELHRRRLAADGLGLEPGGTEFLGEVVRVLDPCGVDDSRRVVEAVAVEAGRGLVEGVMVEDGGQGALLEVAAHDRHRRDRRGGWDAEAAQRRDQPAPGGVAQRQLVNRGREDVGNLLRDQLLGRGHPDEDRVGEAPDREARLLAERGVRFVADDELVRLRVEVVPVAREPGVRLDGHRVRRDPRTRSVLLDRVDEPVAVALGGQLSVKLRDQ